MNGEIFLTDNREPSRVLAQKIPVYIVIDLPGVHHYNKVVVTFPTEGSAHVIEGVHHENMVGGFEDKHFQTVPRSPKYLYGMEVAPWMFGGLLPLEDCRKCDHQDNTVNFRIPNSSFGYSGILIRIRQKNNPRDRANEWMKIYHFNLGKDVDFERRWGEDPNTRLLAHFVPQNVGTVDLTWRSQEVFEENHF